MKIAYLTNQYPAVSHTFIREEIRAVEEGGFEVVRFSIRQSEHPLRDERDLEEARKTTVLTEGGFLKLGLDALAALFTRPLRFFSALATAGHLGLRSERGIWKNIAYLMLACSLLRLLQRAACRHVHVHFGTNPAAVAMLCRLLGGPTYSFTVHGPEEFDMANAISLCEKVHHSEFVAAISSFGRSQLYRFCSHQDWDKILVVRCPVANEYLNDVPHKPQGNPHFVCVGRLSPQKGHLLLIEAAAELKSRGEVFTLTFVGDGHLRDEIESAIDKKGLRGVVSVTGWASGEEVRARIVEARAMVLPSFAEGLPVAIMEALALGRPVVTTYVAGIPELVRDGVCGWLVPAGSRESLTEILARALHTPLGEIERMGEQGHQRVREYHTPNIAVKPLLERFASMKSES